MRPWSAIGGYFDFEVEAEEIAAELARIVAVDVVASQRQPVAAWHQRDKFRSGAEGSGKEMLFEVKFIIAISRGSSTIGEVFNLLNAFSISSIVSVLSF